MARSLRMYGKKRGHRRTGSRTWGSLGEALFFGFFLVLGSLFLAGLLNMLVVPEWRVNHEFIETQGTVLMTRLGEPEDHEPDDEPADDAPPLYRPEVLIEYRAGGKTYQEKTYDIHFHSDRAFTADRDAQAEALAAFEEGEKIAVWYDPADPQTVVVVRGYTWLLWILLLLPVAFILIGGVGLVLTLFHWGKSIEHRVATTQMASRLNPLKEAKQGGVEFPFVPQDSNLTNSPGTRLKYRLPIDLSRGWRLVAILAACLFWNSIVAVFAVIAVNSHLAGRPEWLLTLFVLPFAAVGLAIIYFFVREVLVVTAVGPTQLEISDHPLRPGGRYHAYVSQGGRLTINSLDLSLVCDEVATYRQGTDTRTEQACVYSQPLLHRQQVELLPQAAFEEQLDVEIPAECMHSFKADHNEVRWRLLVRGDIAGWPPFERSFPVVVVPLLAGNQP
ncbi:MAG: DUF3592 domain-containing protein [Pirellulales bacterium]